MPQAGCRTIADAVSTAVPYKNARIDLRIVADISRLLPPDIILSEAEHRQGIPSLTDFPLMHLMQTRDLQLELDELKKAAQHDVWVLFHQWHPRSTFHLTVEFYCHETRTMTSQWASYDNTIQEVINQIRIEILNITLSASNSWSFPTTTGVYNHTPHSKRQKDSPHRDLGFH